MPRFEKDFPHIVETVVPPGGLGKRLNEMHDFYAQQEIQSLLGLERRDDGRYYIRWYFADREIAEAFAKKFAKLEDNVPLQRAH